MTAFGFPVLAIFALVGGATSTSPFLRNPSPSDLLPFLKASPAFPIVTPSIFPPFISNARVDYLVGLPGGRGQPKESCSENRTLALWDFGVITSPKYPEDYPSNTICEWALSAPEGSRIHATIFDIDMQPWFLNYFDSVSFSKDGAFYAVDNYAGDQNEKTPFTILSNATQFGVRFKSNSILNYRGFKLAYIVKPVDDSAAEYESNDDGVCGRATYVVPQPTEPTPTTEAPAPTTEAPAPTTEVPAPTTVLPVENGTRIIGNHSADPHSFPWMVAMLIDHKSFCGGSIIDETHILTAAHCTHGAEHIQLLIGSHNIRATETEEPNRIMVNITKENVFTHPKYNMDRILYDISIIRLPEKLTYSDIIRPVCLPNRKYLAETFEAQNVTVTGWGITADRSKVSPILQQTSVSVLSNAVCRRTFRDLLTGNNICVKTTPTSSPCRGDSGGPLMIREEGVSPHYTVLGVVSFGTSTCERGYPVAFTRVTAFLDYITTITGRRL